MKTPIRIRLGQPGPIYKRRNGPSTPMAIFNGEIALLIPSAPHDIGAIARAQSKEYHFGYFQKDFSSSEERDKSDNKNSKRIQYRLHNFGGLFGHLNQELISHYPNKIINIHPSLLPKFGGKRHVWD